MKPKPWWQLSLHHSYVIISVVAAHFLFWENEEKQSEGKYQHYFFLFLFPFITIKLSKKLKAKWESLALCIYIDKEEEEEALQKDKLKSNGLWIFYFIGVRTSWMMRWHHRVTTAQLIITAALTVGPLPFFGTLGDFLCVQSYNVSSHK